MARSLPCNREPLKTFVRPQAGNYSLWITYLFEDPAQTLEQGIVGEGKSNPNPTTVVQAQTGRLAGHRIKELSMPAGVYNALQL